MTKPKNKKKTKAKGKAQGDDQTKPVQQEVKSNVLQESGNTSQVQKNEVMLSVHCGTMLGHANNLKKVLLEAGYSVFLCDQMQIGEDFRDQISQHAAKCKAFIPFINLQWCQSRECGYEFKIAVRRNLVNKGIPAIMPLLLEDFKVYDDFPSVYGILCSTNGIRVEPSALGPNTWTSVLNALLMHSVPPTSSPSVPMAKFPLLPPSSGPQVPSPVPVVLKERTFIRDLTLFPPHIWADILFFCDALTLGRWCQVSTAFYSTAKRLLGGVVSTFAGTGKPGSSDGPSSSATFKDVGGLAVDPQSGSVLVADSGSNKIRRIFEGTVTTLAGSGSQGSIDGPAAEAVFKMPCGVAVDNYGNVFVADSWNCQIRKISVQGLVSTVAGSGEQGSSDGSSVEATFFCPEGIAVDSTGVIYVSDTKSNKIRKITLDGKVSTIAGSGQRGGVDGNFLDATFSNPVGLAIGQNGEIFVADSLNNKIRKIAQGKVSTVAGREKGFLDGDVSIAAFNKPKGIAFDETDGSLIVADTENHRIRKIDKKGRVYTLAGSQKGIEDGNAKKQAKFTSPVAVAVRAGVIYIAEEKTIRKLSNF